MVVASVGVYDGCGGDGCVAVVSFSAAVVVVLVAVVCGGRNDATKLLKSQPPFLLVE